MGSDQCLGLECEKKNKVLVLVLSQKGMVSIADGGKICVVAMMLTRHDLY